MKRALVDLGTSLKDSGYSFDAIEDVDIASLNLKKRDSDPVLIHRAIHRNLGATNRTASDVALNHFDNNDIVMEYAGDLGPLSPHPEDSHLQKRYTGAGL